MLSNYQSHSIFPNWDESVCCINVIWRV